MASCTVLVDNTVFRHGLGTEHGLSLHLELGPSRTWLWDTGQTGLLVDNAGILGIDLGGIRGVALSHGHYDHTGGLKHLRDRTGFQGPIFGHPACLQSRCRLLPDNGAKSIGMPEPDRNIWLSTFRAVAADTWLEPDLLMVTDIPRSRGNFESPDPFFLDPGGQVPDLLPDDSALVWLAPAGPVLVLGCCHSGLRNTCLAIRDRHGFSSFRVLVGGLHLGSAPVWALEQTIQTITDFGFESVFAGHCTTAPAMDILAGQLSGKMLPLGAGHRFEV